jgi:hypothetical protein
LILAGLSLLTAHGCGSSPVTQGGLHSPDPQTRLEHIAHAARAEDASAIAPLIENLSADDPAVRLYSILALEKLTGTRKGYQAYAPPPQRQAAINRWLADYRDAASNDTAAMLGPTAASPTTDDQP